MEAAGEACDDRTHEAVRRSRPVRAAVDAIWPKVDPVRLVFGLLSRPRPWPAAAEGVLTAAEQAAIAWPSPAPRGPGSARWSAADAVLIDEARDLISRTPSLAHVVVDEAQDLSPMECRALGRRCSTGSATVLGDLAQGTTPWAAPSWPTLLANLGKPDTGGAGALGGLPGAPADPRLRLDAAGGDRPRAEAGLLAAADPGALDLTRVPAASLAEPWSPRAGRPAPGRARWPSSPPTRRFPSWAARSTGPALAYGDAGDGRHARRWFR